MAEDVIIDAHGTDGVYTPVGIFVYAIIAISSLMLIAIAFRKWNVEVDEIFILLTIPYIVLFGALRFVEDLGGIPYPFSILFISPIIYIFAAFILVGIVRVVKYYQTELICSANRSDVLMSFVLIVVMLLTISFELLDVIMILFMSTVGIGVGFLGSCLFIGVLYITKDIRSDKKLLYCVYFVIILSWSLDAVSTFIGIQYGGYVEKNIISLMIINTYGPGWFIIEKVIFAVFFCVLFDYKYDIAKFEKKQLSNFTWFLVIAMISLSLAPAIRNILRISAGI